MILRLLACLVLAVLVFVAAGGALSALAAQPPLRGQMIDVGGGRRMHIICEGPPSGVAGPTIVFEAGAFGFSADWGAVQQMATQKGWRSCSYDRAGAGISDPGPEPRDAMKITDDLHTLLSKAGEKGPYILVGHSMAGLYIPMYANRWPDQVAGLVFVDATTRQASQARAMGGFVNRFAKASKWAAVGASMGLFKPLTNKYGDRIGLPDAAKAEKKHAFANGAHNRNAYAEVSQWSLSAQELVDIGPLNPALPVSVVTAGQERQEQSLRTAPATESRHGYYRNVEAAEHRTLLGLEYGVEVIEGIARVRAALASPRAALTAPLTRGRLIDIGGRRLRLVADGPAADAQIPTVLLEAGAFGFSADWGVVQARLAALNIRSLAYDRAGLGLSDPAPGPRDGQAVLNDLERLLEAADEPAPYVVVGHSMAGLRVQLLAARHPDWIAGVVLVDASTPDATEAPIGRRYLDAFAVASRLFSGLARIGLLKPFSGQADRIGLTGEARAEKQRVFAQPGHNRTARDEVDQWIAAAGQARAAGTYDPAIPLAVVTAGVAPDGHPVKAMMTAPAMAATVRYVKHVPGAKHATLLGSAFADEIIAAIVFVMEAAKTKAAGSPRRPSKI